MPDEIISVNEEAVKNELKEVVRKTVEDSLNTMLDAEADELLEAARFERTERRKGYRAGHYTRKLATTSGEIELRMPKTKGIAYDTAIIERYRRRESGVEEALIETCLAGVSVRRLEDVSELLWGASVSPSTVSKLSKKAYANIEEWRNRPIEGEFEYVWADAIWLKRCWGGSYESVSVLVAVGVDRDGFRHVLGAMEGLKEDKDSWDAFFAWLASRGLKGARLVVGDKRTGIEEGAGAILGAKYQRCVVHFMRNILSKTPRRRREAAALALKAIWAQESAEAALRKAAEVAATLRGWKLAEAASCLEAGIAETTAFYSFPSAHWRLIRTTNMLERLNREIRRRTRVVGAFPDGNSALMLVCARLRYVASKNWGTRPYMSFKAADPEQQA